MKKLPRLFVADENDKTKLVPNKNMERVLNGEGVATLKYDGSATAIINGKFYRRYDLKKGQPLPPECIPCQDRPYDGTTHFPVWNPCSERPDDQWYWNAYNNTAVKEEGSYEAVGPHFQANPYGLEDDILMPHGRTVIEVERTVEGIRKWLEENYEEGLVFWLDGEAYCKVRRRDYAIPWNIKGKTAELY